MGLTKLPSTSFNCPHNLTQQMKILSQGYTTLAVSLDAYTFIPLYANVFYGGTTCTQYILYG